MESIDKLRGWETSVLVEEGGVTTIGKICDEIEAEIERDYMRLPLDADGVPIHVGNTCEIDDYKFEVRQLTTDGSCWWAVDKFGEFYIAELCHHVKPRTLEDVLMDAGVSRAAINDVADEIRELLGGDE